MLMDVPCERLVEFHTTNFIWLNLIESLIEIIDFSSFQRGFFFAVSYSVVAVNQMRFHFRVFNFKIIGNIIIINKFNSSLKNM